MKPRHFFRHASLVTMVIVSAATIGCNLCGDEILQTASSPDNKWIAELASRDCGATTSEYTGLYIEDVKHRNRKTENQVLLLKHIHRVHISWQGNDSLMVDCENCFADEVLKKLETFGPVRITYR